MTTETLPMYEREDVLDVLIAQWRATDGVAAPIYHNCADELETAMSESQSQPRVEHCSEDGCPWTAKPTIARRYNYCPICGSEL